jgi:hypothetical protein
MKILMVLASHDQLETRTERQASGLKNLPPLTLFSGRGCSANLCSSEPH